ncbi:hypothetical protein T06_820, partial [Trichinella sp. T6]
MGGGGRGRRDYNSVWVEGMAARLTIYSGLRECQAGIQFCTDGGNGGRVYNSLWVDEELAC